MGKKTMEKNKGQKTRETVYRFTVLTVLTVFYSFYRSALCRVAVSPLRRSPFYRLPLRALLRVPYVRLYTCSMHSLHNNVIIIIS